MEEAVGVYSAFTEALAKELKYVAGTPLTKTEKADTGTYVVFETELTQVGAEGI
jgi:hypothetical protein